MSTLYMGAFCRAALTSVYELVTVLTRKTKVTVDFLLPLTLLLPKCCMPEMLDSVLMNLCAGWPLCLALCQLIWSLESASRK